MNLDFEFHSDFQLDQEFELDRILDFEPMHNLSYYQDTLSSHPSYDHINFSRCSNLNYSVCESECDCCVCLEPVLVKESQVQIKECKHRYHTHCLN